MNLLEVLFDHDFETREKDDPQVESAYKDFCALCLRLIRCMQMKSKAPQRFSAWPTNEAVSWLERERIAAL